MNDLEIEATELAEKLKSSEDVQLVDVRNAWEHELTRLEGSRLVPLSSLPQRVNELDRDREVIVYCHHGQRSYMAARFLQDQGLKARSLAGGIEHWATTIDPSLPRY